MRLSSRFSLRSLMLATTLAAVVIALYVRYAPQRRLAKIWTARGGKVTYHRPLFGLPLPNALSLCDLRSVDLSRRPITSSDVAAMSELPRLEAIYLARCEVTYETMQMLGRCRRLKRLALWGTTLHDAQVTELSRLRELEVLDIHDTTVTEACLDTLRQLPALKELKFNITLSDQGLSRLAKMQIQPSGDWRLRDVSDVGLRELESIDISDVKIGLLETSAVTDDGLLRLCRRLNSPSFKGCRLNLFGPQFTPKCLDGIPSTGLDGVLLEGTSVRVSDVASRVGTQIMQLDVGGRSVVMHRGVCRPFNRDNSPGWIAVSPAGDWLEESVAWLSSVQYLSLYKVPSLSVRDVLRRCSSIRHIDTYGPLPDDFILELSHLPQLESLNIAWNDGVEPQPLEPLAKLPQLKRVRFTATPFSAEQIRVLGELPSLEDLELHSCHFDRAVIEAFTNFKQLRVRMSRADRRDFQIEEFGQPHVH